MIERKILEEKIRNLENMLLKMYSITVRGVQAIVDLPSDEAFKIIEESEYSSDILNWEIFEEAIATIATQQPTAKDLRFIVMATTIAAVHERINDLALDIAKAIKKIDDVPVELKSSIKTAVETILKMLEVTKNAMVAHSFINVHDKLGKLDDIVDGIFRDTLDFLEGKKDISVRTVMNLVMILRDLERIGDLVGKIGARLIYIETGKMVPIK